MPAGAKITSVDRDTIIAECYLENGLIAPSISGFPGNLAMAMEFIADG